MLVQLLTKTVEENNSLDIITVVSVITAMVTAYFLKKQIDINIEMAELIKQQKEPILDVSMRSLEINYQLTDEEKFYAEINDEERLKFIFVIEALNSDVKNLQFDFNAEESCEFKTVILKGEDFPEFRSKGQGMNIRKNQEIQINSYIKSEKNEILMIISFTTIFNEVREQKYKIFKNEDYIYFTEEKN